MGTLVVVVRNVYHGLVSATGRLFDRCAIITGAGSGIGRAAAKCFAAAGAKLLLCDVADSVFDTARLLDIDDERVVPIVADVGDEQAVQRLVERAVNDLGKLDIMFANAGIAGTLAPFVDLAAEDWESVLRVNLMGTFFCLKHAARHMLAAQTKGTILCTASVAGLRSGGGPAPYSASKAAVINLVRNAACQLAGTGIRVNAICPGLIETGMTQPIFDMARAANKQDRIGQLNPLKRAGEPAEIAKVALMLVTDEASYVNGEAVVVDGGLSASLPMIPGRMW